MKISQIRDMQTADLSEKIREIKAGMAKDRALLSSGTRPENPGNISKAKKTIARILTVLREREIKTKEDKK